MNNPSGLKALLLVTLLNLLLISNNGFSQDFWTETLNFGMNNCPSKFVQDQNGVVYASWGQTTKLHRSDDEGQTWTDLSTNLPYSWPWDYCTYNVLCKNDILFTYVSSTDEEGTGIYRSYDQGLTWENVSADLGVDTNVVDMYLLPNGSLLAYTKTLGTNYSYKLYLSTNDGLNWSLSKDMSIYYKRTFWINSSGELMLYYWNQLDKSTDNGLTWETHISSYSSSVYRDDILVNSGGQYFCNTSTSGFGFQVSEDEGITWSDCTNANIEGHYINSNCITIGDTLYAGTTKDDTTDFFYYSADNAESWHPVGATGIFSPDKVNALTLTQSGYLLTSIHFDGIYRSSEPVSASSSSIKDISQDINLNVYPNPTKSNLYIEADGILQLELYNLKGQLLINKLVTKKGNSMLNIENLANGVYSLKVITNKGIGIKKVIIE